MKRNHLLSTVSLTLSILLFSCTNNLPGSDLTVSESNTALKVIAPGTYEFDLGKSVKGIKKGGTVTVKINTAGFTTKASTPGSPKKTFSDITNFMVNLCTDPTRPLNTAVFTPVSINFTGNVTGSSQQTITYLNVPGNQTYYATVQAMDGSSNNITEKDNNGSAYASPDIDAQIAVSSTSVNIDSNLTLTPLGPVNVDVNLLNAVGADIDTQVTPVDGGPGLFNNNILGEYQVNTYQTSDQMNPSVAAYDGGFVVVWDSNGQDGDQEGIFARIFDRYGRPKGDEFQVNTTTAGSQRNPDVAIDNNGNFIIGWEGLHTNATMEIYRRRYDSNGTPLTGQTLTTNDAGNQTNAAVTMNGAGQSAITWETDDTSGGRGIRAQVYNADGSTVTAPITIVNAVNNQTKPDIGIDNSQRIVVTWQDDLTDGDQSGVYVRGTGSGGQFYFSQFKVNSITAGNQSNPSIAMGDNGNFVISWDSQNLDADAEGIAVRSYASGGTPNEGSDNLINTFATGSQLFPKVAVNKNFTEEVLTWQSFQDLGGTNFGIYFIKKNFNPLILSTEKKANTTLTNDQINPDASINNMGNYVIVWEGTDSDSKGIFVKRFRGVSEL